MKNYFLVLVSIVSLVLISERSFSQAMESTGGKSAGKLTATIGANGAAATTFGMLMKQQLHLKTVHVDALAACSGPQAAACVSKETAAIGHHGGLATMWGGMMSSAISQGVSQAGNLGGARRTQREAGCMTAACLGIANNNDPNNNNRDNDGDPTPTPPPSNNQDRNDPFRRNGATGGGGSTAGNPFGANGGGLTEGDKARIGELLRQENELKKAGFKIDHENGTITTPDGKTFNTASFSSPGAMAAAGFKQNQINDAMKGYAEAMKAGEKEYRRILAQEEAGGGALDSDGGMAGGAGSAAGGAAGGDKFDMGAYLRKMNGADGAAGEGRGVAGLQKKIGNESIGVAGDNIFQMVSRKYQHEQHQGNFLRER